MATSSEQKYRYKTYSIYLIIVVTMFDNIEFAMLQSDPISSKNVARKLDLNSFIGQCPCDLTGHSCDINCCCDADCSSDDKKVFSECLPFSTDVDEKLCFRKEIILFENSNPVISDVTDDGLFCIFYDNQKERNYYKAIGLVTTQEEFDAYQVDSQFVSYHSRPAERVDLNSTTMYKSGNPVYTVTKSGTFGVLGLPRSLMSSVCIDSNPVAYLMNQEFSCIRQLSQCTTAVGLDGNNYVNYFKVVKNPIVFQEYNVTKPLNENFTNLYNSDQMLKIELDNTSLVNPLQCADVSGVTTACNFTDIPSPTPTTSAICNNAVKQVNYRLTTDGSSGIVRVLVSFVFTSVKIPLSGTSFRQTFTTTFFGLNDTQSFKRSGSPGYVVGEPVLAGIFHRTTFFDVTRERIVIKSSRDHYMTVVSPTADGQCSVDQNHRHAVLFGQNVRTGCIMRISNDNLTHYCDFIQERIINTMEFDATPSTSSGFSDTNYVVGLYGDADVTKSGDWVKVLYQNRLKPSTLGTSGCQLSLGMHIKILYTNIGALVNPQAKIIGVNYVYDTPTAVLITKPAISGMFSQPVEISSSVMFVDVSKRALRHEGEFPIILPTVPFDFFYPFLSGQSPASFHVSYCLLLSPFIGLMVRVRF